MKTVGMLAKKEFGICEIPEDIRKKREKKQARDSKANEAAKPESEMTAFSSFSLMY